MATEHHKLKEDSLGLGESIIMGIAGTAPAYSLAATTSILFSLIGLSSIASLLYTGLIMFGVSLAFLHLNRINTNAGASYAWVGDVFHPILGFFAGWSLLVASAVFMVSGTIPAAIATLALFNPAYINQPIIVAIIAACWLIFVSLIVVKGIKLSSYFQLILTLVEVVLLAIIIIGALWKFSLYPVQPFSLNQLSLTNFTPESFAAGALTSLFFFWGWDVTVNLSEETKNAADNPGRGAVGAMFIVLTLFASFLISVQFAMNPTEIVDASSNIVLALSEKVFLGTFSYIAVIAVMLSTVGTLETTMLQFTRTMFAKGRSGILNPRYAQLHKKWKTPWYSTALITLIGLFLLLCSAFFPTVDQIILVSVKAIGFQVAFYYGLTCFACASRFRQIGLSNPKEFIFLFLWPLLSGFFMTFIFIYCARTFDWKTTALGIGGILIGVVPLLLNKKFRK